MNYSKFHKNIPFFKPGCLKLCCVVQGQFLPEAWGFAMACHRLPDLVYPYTCRDLLQDLCECLRRGVSNMTYHSVSPTGDQGVANSTPAGLATFFCRDLNMKYFLRSFSPFRKIQACQLSVSGEMFNRLED